MGSFNYDKMADTAQRLLTRFGATWVLTKVNKGDYNPSNNTRLSDTTTDYNVKGVRREYRDSQIDGEVIKRGDILLIMEAKALSDSPTPFDKVSFNGQRWSIIKVKEINPANKAIIYQLQLRK